MKLIISLEIIKIKLNIFKELYWEFYYIQILFPLQIIP
jgi:hypothetical protein